MVHNIDTVLFSWINGYLHFTWLDPVMAYITQINHFQLILVMAILGMMLFAKNHERVTIILLIIAVIISDTFGSFLKHFFLRLRPEHVLDNVRLLVESSSRYSYSFPSNHAVNTAAIATVLVLRYPKKKIIGYCGILVSLLVSYSRIYVGVHYPTDVIFGWIIGILCAGLVIRLLNDLNWDSRPDADTIFGINYGALLTLFLIMITIFRLKYIQDGPLNLVAEEAQYWNWSRHLDWSYYSKGPMIAYLIYGFTKFGGNTAFAIRLGAVVISGILTYLTYFFTQKMFGSKRIGFYAALVMNLLPLFSAGAVLMTTDTPLILFWALTINFVYFALTSDKPIYWYLAGVAFGLGLLSKYTMGILPLSLFLYFLLVKDHRVWLKKKEPYLSLLVGLIVFSPVLYWNYAHGWISARHLLGLSQVSQGMKVTLIYLLEYLGSQIGIITPWIFAGLIYAWWVSWSPAYRTLERATKFPAYTYLWFNSIPIFLVFLLKSIQGKVQANWAAPAYYTGMILMVAVFDKKYHEAASERQKKKIALYSWSAILLTAILILLLHNPEYLVKLKIPMKAKYDVTNRLRGWQELGNEVSKVKDGMANETASPPIFIFSGSYQIASELAFYTIGKPETYCINLGRRMNQYDIWDGWDKLIGQNAIYITDDTTELSLSITSSFTRCELIKNVPICRYNQKIREYYIYQCYNFKGLLNSNVISY